MVTNILNIDLESSKFVDHKSSGWGPVISSVTCLHWEISCMSALANHIDPAVELEIEGRYDKNKTQTKSKPSKHCRLPSKDLNIAK